MKKKQLPNYISLLLFITNVNFCYSQPAWSSIKANATFNVVDTSYHTPQIQPLNVGGWEDGLFISRDGLTLYCYYLPFDVFSLLGDFALNPICFNSQPYYRPPLFDVDTVTNPFGCPNYFQGDILISTRPNTTVDFSAWQSSNLKRSISNEGAPQGIQKNTDTLDLFVFSQNRNNIEDMDIQLLRNTPNNPEYSSSTTIISSLNQEDNPHIERLDDSNLVLLFDRDGEIFYSLSSDNGYTWQTEILITNVINDQSPYDVQPHLWNDGSNWWVYFCANNPSGKRSIYRSKQLIENDWNSWSTRELVIEPIGINGGYGEIFGIGEPSLTTTGDLSFVVIYGNNTFPDTTDVFDSDPWIMKKKDIILSSGNSQEMELSELNIYPNPANNTLTITTKSQLPEVFLIYGISGQIMNEILIHNSSVIDIQHLPSGIYYVQSQTDKSKSKSFIKK